MPKISDTTKGVIYLALSAATLGIVFAYWMTHQPAYRDPITQCAASRESGHTIVVVDKTDPWNQSQASRLETHILWLVAERMKTEERLSIFSFGAEFEPGFPPLFSFCKPESAADADDIVKSKRFFQRQFDKEFIQPLKSVLDDLKKPGTGPCSKIVLVLLEIMNRREVVDHRGVNRLVLISDLAENSAIYSVYRGLIAGQSCFASRDPIKDPRQDWSALLELIKSKRPGLPQNELEIVVFQNPPPATVAWIDNLVKPIWRDIFKALDARRVEWFPL